MSAKITSFDKKNVTTLHNEMTKELEAIFAKYGLSLGKNNIRYNAANLTFKVEVAVKHDGIVKDKKYVALETFYPEYVEKEFMHPQLGKCIVVGYNTRAPKYPFIIETDAGKRYKMPLSEFNEYVK